MIGYMQLYFKLTNDKEVAYSKMDFDFGTVVTLENMESLKNLVLEYYTKLENKSWQIDFCTKEEYENNEGKAIAEYTWNAEGENKWNTKN